MAQSRPPSPPHRPGKRYPPVPVLRHHPRLQEPPQTQRRTSRPQTSRRARRKHRATQPPRLLRTMQPIQRQTHSTKTENRTRETTTPDIPKLVNPKTGNRKPQTNIPHTQGRGRGVPTHSRFAPSGLAKNLPPSLTLCLTRGYLLFDQTNRMEVRKWPFRQV